MRGLVHRLKRRALVAAALAFAGTCLAAEPVWTDRADGLSCAFIDVGIGLPWPEGAPRWLDAKGVAGGPAAFATHRITAGDGARVRRLDVTRLAQAWWTGGQPNQGLLLRLLSGDPLTFVSREFADVALRPTLALKWADGRRKLLEATADAALDCSTYKGLGETDTLMLSGHSPLALRFTLRPEPGQPPPAEAQLWLTRTTQGLGAPASFEVQQLYLGLGEAAPPRTGGLASRHPRDAGLEREPEVLFVDRFEGGKLSPAWAVSPDSNVKLVDNDAANGFAALDGGALRITIDKGGQLGSDLRYKFRQHQSAEPEEIYVRYYLRLGRSWTGAVEGGKLPGLAGTYGQAGWGGRGWDGNKGWSLRGSFGLPTGTRHPMPGHLMLGTYAYHGGSGSTYGEILPWSGSQAAGLVALDRWVCIEQHVRLNTPGRNDGLLEVWVDGRPALLRRDLRLRNTPALRIEEFWLNIFHGGLKTAAAPMHAFVDNVVIARSYIGPMAP